MYLTKHVVEDQNDKREIHSRISYDGKEYDPKQNELFICILDDQKPIGCATISFLEKGYTSLDELILLEKYCGSGIEIDLVNYIVYELRMIDKKALIINIGENSSNVFDNTWVDYLDIHEENGKKIIYIKKHPPSPSMARAG